ncbi:hypothetical protein [Rhodopirellula bahusiensis]|uniref:hypothetical protein n=1 Tax=Rhodopirellula bahusiensis TaxID=2014065 RepID=UPI0032644BEE
MSMDPFEQIWESSRTNGFSWGYPAEMTQEGHMGLTVDGANRAFGPLIYGFQAFSLFCVVAVALFVIRAMMFRRPVAPPLEATSEDEINVATDLPTSDNPYHPPADPS